MGLFNNLALLYICVLIASMFYSPVIVLGTSPSARSILNFFDVGVDSSNSPVLNQMNFSSTTSDASSRLLAEGRSTDKDNSPLQSFLSLIDTLWNAIKFIELFFRFLFAPLIILSSMNAPSFIIFTIGVPFVFSGLVSIIMIIRGYA